EEADVGQVDDEVRVALRDPGQVRLEQRRGPDVRLAVHRDDHDAVARPRGRDGEFRFFVAERQLATTVRRTFSGPGKGSVEVSAQNLRTQEVAGSPDAHEPARGH